LLPQCFQRWVDSLSLESKRPSALGTQVSSGPSYVEGFSQLDLA